jgi:RNA polymerase sigma factor (sigma-70 family)
MENSNTSLIGKFLALEENKKLYEEYLMIPTARNKELLDLSFKKFYKELRVFSYLNKTIYYESKNLDKKFRIHRDRYQLILDKPLSGKDESMVSIIDMLVDETAMTEFEEIPSIHLGDYFQNTIISNSVKNLTAKQKQILFLSFVENLQDKDIARILNVSQQAISKTKNTALVKVRRDIIA